jgi:hypothetical protein
VKNRDILPVNHGLRADAKAFLSIVSHRYSRRSVRSLQQGRQSTTRLSSPFGLEISHVESVRTVSAYRLDRDVDDRCWL